VALSKGRLIYVGSGSALKPDAEQLVWDIVSLQQKLEWLPPTGVLGGIWTQDGHFLAATSTPQALHLWRLR
jgi:hypothetical protein